MRHFVVWLALAGIGQPEPGNGPVTPVSPGGKLVGGLLGVASLVAAVFLVTQPSRHRRVDESLDPRRGYSTFVPTSFATLTANTPWRVPTAITLALTGIIVGAGVWVNPRSAPIAFLTVWTIALFLVAILLIVASLDLMTIRRRALEERMRLLEDHRARLARDLRERPKG